MLGALGNGRVLLVQLRLDSLGTLFVGPGDGLLRGEAPALEVLAYAADRQLDAKLLLHQQQHRSSTAQSQLQLLGTVLANQPLNVQFLLCCEPTLLAGCASSWLWGQRLETHALPMQSHRLFAPLVLSLPRQLASVLFIHPNKMGIVVKKSTLNCRVNRKPNRS